MTDLEEILQRRESLSEELQAYVQPHEIFGKMLRHPLVFLVPFSDELAAYANAMLDSKQAAVAEAARQGDIRQFVFLHERPHRVEALATANSLMKPDPALVWSTVKSVWTDSENVGEMAWLWERIWSGEAFGPPSAEDLMSADERMHLDRAPSEIDLYRGQEAMRPPGWSWTDDQGIAEWFARRTSSMTGMPATVLHARVPKSDIAAFLSDRGEAEYVITNAARQRIGAESRAPGQPGKARHLTIPPRP